MHLNKKSEMLLSNALYVQRTRVVYNFPPFLLYVTLCSSFKLQLKTVNLGMDYLPETRKRVSMIVFHKNQITLASTFLKYTICFVHRQIRIIVAQPYYKSRNTISFSSHSPEDGLVSFPPQVDTKHKHLRKLHDKAVQVRKRFSFVISKPRISSE